MEAAGPTGPEPAISDKPTIVEYRAAMAAYESKQYDEAARLFREIWSRNPRSDVAIHSLEHLFEILLEQGKTDEVRALWDEIETRAPDTDRSPAFMATVGEMHEIEARDAEAKGNFAQCGRSFVAAAEASPKPGNRDQRRRLSERYARAASCFDKAHLVGQALKARMALLGGHPEGPLAADALFAVAQGYYRLMSYSRAADSFEEFARKFPRDRRASSAVRTAAELRAAVHEEDTILRSSSSSP